MIRVLKSIGQTNDQAELQRHRRRREHFIRLIVVLFKIYARTIFSPTISLHPSPIRPSCETLDRMTLWHCLPMHIRYDTEDKSVWNSFFFHVPGLRRKLHLLCNVCIFHGTWNSFLCCKQRNNAIIIWYANFADRSDTRTHCSVFTMSDWKHVWRVAIHIHQNLFFPSAKIERSKNGLRKLLVAAEFGWCTQANLYHSS